MSNTSDTSSVLESARQAAADVGLDPTKLAQDVGARIRDAAEAQKNAGAEKVLGVARAIRSAAGELEDESPEVARYVRSAAASIEGFTQDFNDRSVDDLTQAVVDMARRSPGLFFAGSVMAGFALFRFLNAAQGEGAPSSTTRKSGGRQPTRMAGQSGHSSNSPSIGARPSGGKGGYGSSDAGGYDVGTTSTSNAPANATGRQSGSIPAGSSTARGAS